MGPKPLILFPKLPEGSLEPHLLPLGLKATNREMTVTMPNDGLQP